VAESLISAISLNRVSKVDQKLRNGSETGSLDVVVNAENNRGASKNQSSLQKIASFKPNQLKSFSSKISTSIAQRKQSAQIKVAEQAVVKEKVQELRDQNPFKKNNPVEEQKGRKISLSA
tara:strand:- start:3507 stop:3866 length:360 start_codon:yes stop_codon:yes gene_type:complete